MRCLLRRFLLPLADREVLLAAKEVLLAAKEVLLVAKEALLVAKEALLVAKEVLLVAKEPNFIGFGTDGGLSVAVDLLIPFSSFCPDSSVKSGQVSSSTSSLLFNEFPKPLKNSASLPDLSTEADISASDLMKIKSSTNLG